MESALSAEAVLSALLQVVVVLAMLQCWGTGANAHVDQPLSTIGIHQSLVALDSSVSISASPDLLGVNVRASLLSQFRSVPLSFSQLLILQKCF